MKTIGFENANEDSQASLWSLREKEDIMVYLKACSNVYSVIHQAHVSAI